jgi:hypothetical protein
MRRSIVKEEAAAPGAGTLRWRMLPSSTRSCSGSAHKTGEIRLFWKAGADVNIAIFGDFCQFSAILIERRGKQNRGDNFTPSGLVKKLALPF